MWSWSKIKAYVKEHQHHFLISLGVSLLVTISTNILIHYLAYILRFLHVPLKIVHMITGK